MLELTDFDDSRISYLARISRGHHVDTLLVPREYKDTFESTELYEVLLPNISIGGVQFAKIYYYDVEMIVAGDHMTQVHLYLMLVME